MKDYLSRNESIITKMGNWKTVGLRSTDSRFELVVDHKEPKFLFYPKDIHFKLKQTPRSAPIWLPPIKRFNFAFKDEHYILKFQEDGDLVLTLKAQRWIESEKKFVPFEEESWRLGVAGKGGERLVGQSDGNLVMYTKDKKVVWSSNSWKKTKNYPFFIIPYKGREDGIFMHDGRLSTNGLNIECHNYGGKLFDYMKEIYVERNPNSWWKWRVVFKRKDNGRNKAISFYLEDESGNSWSKTMWASEDYCYLRFNSKTPRINKINMTID